MTFTESELAYLNEMRSLSTDPHGRIIFVGLTLEESIRFKAYNDTFIRSEAWEDPDEYIRLTDKHEIARIAVIAAEAQARNQTPTSH